MHISKENRNIGNVALLIFAERDQSVHGVGMILRSTPQDMTGIMGYTYPPLGLMVLLHANGFASAVEKRVKWQVVLAAEGLVLGNIGRRTIQKCLCGSSNAATVGIELSREH